VRAQEREKDRKNVCVDCKAHKANGYLHMNKAGLKKTLNWIWSIEN